MKEGNAGICDIYEALKSSTGYHVVEEYFEGGNLDAKRINIGGYFDEMRCTEIIEQVLQVLCFLHEKKLFTEIFVRPASCSKASKTITFKSKS
jgi:serine/threonine protein kinase